MDFVNEEDVLAAEVGEDGGQVASALDGRTGSRPDIDADLGGDNIGQSGFAEAGRAIE